MEETMNIHATPDNAKYKKLMADGDERTICINTANPNLQTIDVDAKDEGDRQIEL